MKVIVGVTGGIAAYKAVELVRLFQTAGLDPHIVMTAAAQNFVQPLTFSAISGHKVITSLWEPQDPATQPDPESAIAHIHEAQTASALIVAPATADIIAKFAHGLADDFLTTIYLATKAPILVAPAMNVNMHQHPATQANLDLLRARGVTIVEPGSGHLACGMTGSGRLADLPAIVEATIAAIAGHAASAPKRDLAGETILITAGGTREPIDPVRFIGNRSSGRMGYALAEAALARGARVIFITAPTALPIPSGVETLPVTTAAEMSDAVLAHLPEATTVIMAAAISDYRLAEVPGHKLKREGPLTLSLIPTPDIISEVVARRTPGTLVIGFAAETENLLPNARAKLLRKGIDAIVANDVSSPALGFDSENNAGTFITHNTTTEIPATTKQTMAHRILDQLRPLRARLPSPTLHE